MVVASLMASLLYLYFERLDSERASIDARLRMLNEGVLSGSVVDAYYIPSNSTVVIVLYLTEPIEVRIVRAYVDAKPVLPSNYVSGFDTPIPVNTFFTVSFTAQLTPGRHSIVLITAGGGRIEATIQA